MEKSRGEMKSGSLGRKRMERRGCLWRRRHCGGHVVRMRAESCVGRGWHAAKRPLGIMNQVTDGGRVVKAWLSLGGT